MGTSNQGIRFLHNNHKRVVRVSALQIWRRRPVKYRQTRKHWTLQRLDTKWRWELQRLGIRWFWMVDYPWVRLDLIHHVVSNELVAGTREATSPRFLFSKIIPFYEKGRKVSAVRYKWSWALSESDDKLSSLGPNDR